jgi:hypothetical protein
MISFVAGVWFISMCEEAAILILAAIIVDKVLSLDKN